MAIKIPKTQHLVIWYGKDYLMVTEDGIEVFVFNGEVDTTIVSYYKCIYENQGFIILDVINTDLMDSDVYLCNS